MMLFTTNTLEYKERYTTKQFMIFNKDIKT